MIRAIITDVDGVIVGDKKGINFPLPNERIIQKLKELKKRGIPVVLCTGKFNFAIEEIIKRAELDNPHITDGGALIYNPLRNEIIKEHILQTSLAQNIVETCIKNNFYIEVFSAKDFYIQKNQRNEFSDKRIVMLQKEHKEIDSLVDIIPIIEVIKILVFVKDATYKSQLESVIKPFRESIDTAWTTAPFLFPTLLHLITVKDVSKKNAAIDVMDSLHISFDNVLGIGDLPVDWQFINLCKYGATVGAIDEEFRKNIKKKGTGNYFFGSSVDENGFIEIVDYFIR